MVFRLKKIPPFGGIFFEGFVAGASGGLGAKGWTGMVGENIAKNGEMIAFGALAGGVGAELSGGNFFKGFLQGGIVAGLNHAMHKISTNASLKKELVDAGYDPKAVANYTKEEVYNLIQKVRSLSSLYGKGNTTYEWGASPGTEDYDVIQNGKGMVAEHNTSKMTVRLVGNSLENGYIVATPKAILLSKNAFSSYFGLAKTLGVAYIHATNYFYLQLQYNINTAEKMPKINNWLHKVGH